LFPKRDKNKNKRRGGEKRRRRRSPNVEVLGIATEIL
jgi:hypothetical protein